MLSINYSICRECAACLKVCKHGPLRASKDNLNRPELVSDGVGCFLCGHCLSVCPAGAITIDGAGAADLSETRQPVSDYDNFINFIRTRRSVRNYVNEPLDGELVAKVINAARYSPTAKNSAGVRVTVVSGENVRKLAQITFDFYKKLTDMVKSPIKKYIFMLAAGYSTVRAIENNMASFEYGYNMWINGVDLLFYDAPALLITHADKKLVMPKDDCSYALYAMSLAASSLGLGSCINGYFLRAAEHSDEIKNFIKLPQNHQVYGAMTLGRCSVKYQKTPQRKPVETFYIS